MGPDTAVLVRRAISVQLTTVARSQPRLLQPARAVSVPADPQVSPVQRRVAGADAVSLKLLPLVGHSGSGMIASSPATVCCWLKAEPDHPISH